MYLELFLLSILTSNTKPISTLSKIPEFALSLACWFTYLYFSTAALNVHAKAHITRNPTPLEDLEKSKVDSMYLFKFHIPSQINGKLVTFEVLTECAFSYNQLNSGFCQPVLF